MILKLSLTVLLLYYLAVLWKYYRQDIAGIFGTAETDEDTDGTGKEPGQPGEPYTVMGESTYCSERRTGRKRQPEPWTNPQRRTTGRTTPTSSRRRTRRRRIMNHAGGDPETGGGRGIRAYYPDGNPDFATGYSFDDLKKVRRTGVGRCGRKGGAGSP